MTSAEREHALDVITQEARIGLVVARPADVLAVIGWGGLDNRGDSLLPLTAVLRSWEDRFGARLIAVGDADAGLFVERPPRTLQAAQRIAAEQVVLADECIAGAWPSPHRGTPGELARVELLVGLSQRCQAR